MMPEPETFTTGYTVLKQYPVKIPLLIYEVCSYLAKQDTSHEFAIIVKSKNTDKGYVLTEEFLVPEQTVTGASVDFDNVKLLEYRKQGYNTVIHFHPMSLKTFSETDDRYINTHFDVSVLFCDNQFTDAVVNLEVNGMRIQIKGAVELDIPDFGIQLNNIKKQRTYTPYTSSTGLDSYWEPYKYGSTRMSDYDFYEVKFLDTGFDKKDKSNKKKVKKWK